jgi:hypothetical protein
VRDTGTGLLSLISKKIKIYKQTRYPFHPTNSCKIVQPYQNLILFMKPALLLLGNALPTFLSLVGWLIAGYAHTTNSDCFQMRQGACPSVLQDQQTVSKLPQICLKSFKLLSKVRFDLNNAILSRFFS